MRHPIRSAVPVVAVLLTVSVLAACSGGSAGSSPSDAHSPTLPAPASAAPPSESPPGAGGVEPGMPDSERVDPQPGQQNVMSIPIERLEASADGRTVTITVHWSSGVAPCSVLDQVLLNVGDDTVDVTIREGTSDPNAACVLMLQAKHTVVSVELEPGDYTIRDTEGLAPPVEVTVA